MRVDVIDQAVRSGNLYPLIDRLKNKSEKERVKIVRLMVRNGNYSLFDLISSEIKGFNEENQKKILVDVATTENVQLLSHLLKLDEIFYEDVVIDSLYSYDLTINPTINMVNVFWEYMNDYERNSIDIVIKSRYRII